MRTRLGTVTLCWRSRKWVWSNRSLLFGPVTGTLNELVWSPRLSALVDEFEAWLEDTTCRATRLAHTADLWAIETGKVAAKDPFEGFRPGGRNLASSRWIGPRGGLAIQRSARLTRDLVGDRTSL